MSRASNLTRREWLLSTAAVPLLAAPQSKSFGVQLYSLRSILKREPDRALKAIADIGFKEIEGYSRPDMPALIPRLKQYGLTPRSCYIETPLITADWELYPEFKRIELPQAIDSLGNAGIEYFTMDYISPGARGDGEDFYRRTADRMNAAAELCHKSRLKFAYRTHAFEFEGRSGKRPVDLLTVRLDPKLVTFEVDVFWASVAGLDPVELLKSWKGRVSMVHLQDKAKGTPGQFNEAIGQGTFTEAGAGVLDFPAILKAAAAAGARYYFIEQDETQLDPIESLRQSFAYLKTI